MKLAAYLSGIATVALVSIPLASHAQHTAAGITGTISAANTVNQSQQAPPRDAAFERAYGRQPAAGQSRTRTAPAVQPQAGARAVQQQPGVQPQSRVAQQQPQRQPRQTRDAAFERLYGSQPPATRSAPAQAQGQQPAAVPVVVRPAKKVDPDREKRLIEFQRQKAIGGSPSAQYDLGMRYLKGDGLEKSREQAEEWLKMSAQGGYSRAERQLATLEQAAPATKPADK